MKRNDNAQKKILQRQNEMQKKIVFPKPETPLLSDKSEFPSLSESLGRASNCSASSSISLKYSDKLKSPLLSRNQVFGISQLKYDASGTSTHQHGRNSISRLRVQSADDKDKVGNSSNQNISKWESNHSLNKTLPFTNKINNTSKKEIVKQKPVLKPKHDVPNVANKSTACSDDANTSAKSNSHSKKPITLENTESKEGTYIAQWSVKEKKKNKRKSKVKRQVALQSGKITFLTPEIHSKILNQASTLNAQNTMKSSVIGNINDQEEYPELGKAVLPVCQKENSLKMNISEYQEVADESTDSTVEQNAFSEIIVKESPAIVEKNEKVHSHHPITISFYEMLLLEKNVKQRQEKDELQIEDEAPTFIGLSKLKNKKNSNHPHNLLDSSSPAVKRGKERENPKPKKPSQLKKIILLDRKVRREHLLQMKNNLEEENISNEDDHQSTTEKSEQCPNNLLDDLPDIFEDSEESVDDVLTEITDFCVPDELISEMMQLNISDGIDSYNITNDLSSNFEKVIEDTNLMDKSSSTSPLKGKLKTEEDNSTTSQISNQPDTDTKLHLNFLQPPDTLLSSLAENTKFEISDKEKAVKILLHTRNFREYCNHLISKDIDDATHALLDDLARFQDRLHQKDPIKAKMKKRMIYGVKEVKKHIKLRKLKCIVIAVDIENVETQGGLNDILNEIKVSAVDHHIPCVFALSRKVLGKVCRKPVPVSCVGVFNYEGSETNFKKMVELQSQSKTDYNEIFNKLLKSIKDEEVTTLIKAKKEAPEALRDVRTNILSDFFLLTDTLKEDENVDLKPNDKMSDLIF